jgi:hypothetical protein
MTTTLNKIKAHSPCSDGWNKLLNHLGKKQVDDEPLSIATIIQSNGIKDAVWALCAVEGKDKEIRLFAADCAESVLHIYEKQYPNDDRPRKAIQAARDYANGLINEDKLSASRDAACAAAGAAAGEAAGEAAGAAAGAAAGEAAGEAAWAAWDATRAAAWEAAWEAARDAGGAAAGAAARAAAMAAKWQEIELLLTKYL